MKLLYFILSIFLLSVIVNAVPYLPTAAPTPPTVDAGTGGGGGSNGGYDGPPTEAPMPNTPIVSTVAPIYPTSAAKMVQRNYAQEQVL